MKEKSGEVPDFTGLMTASCTVEQAASVARGRFPLPASALSLSGSHPLVPNTLKDHFWISGIPAFMLIF